ncbi:uncharacterized protein LOC117172070 isoform X3 [Belonocnema kinseyi]|uniref:uncharacterized protein LOC117172070 isoform X3 n=1 Tax=Belonocnema kinseyi TaxID=2817044 RepID=UPI00143E0699|nr:uncharacterized protein LOC117172070 isoform X3 [Belonocnema kinseyi]
MNKKLSTKLTIKKSPKMENNFVSTKIIHVASITPKSNYHKNCLSPYVNSKGIGFVRKSSDGRIKKRCSVYVSKSERNHNINVISIKSNARTISTDSKNSAYQNSTEMLKHPRVEILKSVNNNKTITPQHSRSVATNQIKIDHRSCTKSKTAKSGYLDRNLSYNTEYKDDFIEFQLELDSYHKLSPTFLTKNISAEQRRLSIKNLLKFAAESNFPSYVIFQSVRISDAMIDLKNVKEDWELEFINLSALWISLKRLHPYDDIPSIKKLMRWKNDKNGIEKLIIDCEKDILKTLNFEISFPDPISMVVLCLKNVDDDYPYELMYYTSLYMIDLILLNEYFSQIPVSILVIVTAQISLFTSVDGVENMKYPPWHFWRSQFPKMLSAKERLRCGNNQKEINKDCSSFTKSRI